MVGIMRATLLTRKQLLFCYEYIAEKFKGTRAAKKAGYKGSSRQLSVIAAQNLKKLSVQAKIAELTERYLNGCGIRVIDLLKELHILAFCRMGDFVEIDSDTGNIRSRNLTEIGEKSAAIKRIYIKQQFNAAKEGEKEKVFKTEIVFVLYDKIKPLSILAESCGLFNHSTEHPPTQL